MTKKDKKLQDLEYKYHLLETTLSDICNLLTNINKVDGMDAVEYKAAIRCVTAYAIFIDDMVSEND